MQQQYLQNKRLQRRNIAKKKNKKKQQVDEFQGRFSSILTIAHEMWLQQNKDQHPTILSQRKTADHTNTMREVMHLYSLQIVIMLEDSDSDKIYKQSVEFHLQESCQAKMKWVNSLGGKLTIRLNHNSIRKGKTGQN